jgi:hypothetical protein
LFPHPCTRLTPVGCPDCNGGQLDDPYRSRRSDWGDDDTSSDWDDDAGSTAGEADPADVNAADLTEADGETLAKTEDDDFERDMGAS